VNTLDDSIISEDDFAHLARLAIAGQQDDVRLFVAKLVRKYRSENPEFADRLDQFLKDRRHARSSSPLRRTTPEPAAQLPLPTDQETRLSLLKRYEDLADAIRPLLSNKLQLVFDQLIRERRQIERLTELGLHPTRSAIFLGPPGVGKTLTARWLAAQLNVPLLVLDLTTVMSSLLGKTGANIRAALEYAKQTPSVLLLDEIDAIAKRRSDDSDVGELKRLVTVMLQEVDDWPTSGLLLAATNHPELIDPALWRRFDLVVEFHLPEPPQVKEAVLRFAGNDTPFIDRWLDVLTYAFRGTSFSDIERTLNRIRRTVALGGSRIDELVEDLVRSRIPTMSKEERLVFAGLLEAKTKYSQRAISEWTGLARDTIRKQRTQAKEQTSAKEAR
jgi:SpoVK/Ycf46/Vps4 family AAA+-type ATPase